MRLPDWRRWRRDHFKRYSAIRRHRSTRSESFSVRAKYTTISPLIGPRRHRRTRRSCGSNNSIRSRWTNFRRLSLITEVRKRFSGYRRSRKTAARGASFTSGGTNSGGTNRFDTSDDRRARVRLPVRTQNIRKNSKISCRSCFSDSIYYDQLWNGMNARRCPAKWSDE